MSRSTLLSLACVAGVAAASCAQEGLDTVVPPGSGGAQSTGSGGTTTAGSGGTTTPGSGGTTTPGSGGTTTVGSGGTTAGSGGTTAGSGGATAGSGGRGTGGTTGSGGSGSGGRGSGGATGSGGRGGTVGSGGATGGGGAGGAGGGLNINTIVPGFDGYYWEGTCSGNVSASGRNCPFYATGVTTCPSGTSWDNRGTIKNQMLTVGGTTGTRYTINFEVRGVVGTRCYTGGTISSTAVPNANGPNNAWYRGGRQYNDSIWNTYEIRVEPPVTGEPNVYFANAFGTEAVNTSWCQKEATYEVRYMASFAVMGGGTIRFTIHDSNCQAQQNCGGDDTATTCNARRTINLADLSPPGTFTQPPTNQIGANTYSPQWLYFDVKSVTSP